MEKYVFQFTDWILQHYGRLGLLIFLLIFVTVLAVGYYLLSRLPESPKVIVWSKCSSCKYKREKGDNTFVMLCHQYEQPGWQFKRLACPNQKCGAGDIFKYDLENPHVFNRADLPKSVLDDIA